MENKKIITITACIIALILTVFFVDMKYTVIIQEPILIENKDFGQANFGVQFMNMVINKHTAQCIYLTSETDKEKRCKVWANYWGFTQSFDNDLGEFTQRIYYKY